MTDDKLKNSDASPASRAGFGPPFGGEFFVSLFGERVRAACRQQKDKVPVVELHLADGTTLDLCHIERLFPEWMGVMVYRDTKTCAEMDMALVPYGLITRITVSTWPIHQRRIGFQLNNPVDAVQLELE